MFMNTLNQKDALRRTSTLSTVYFTCAIAGLVATWYFNWQYIVGGGGFLPSQFFGAAFANVLTTAITIDVYFAAFVFSIWVIAESKRSGVKRPWLYVALCFSVGLAFAFPLYLAFKERSGNDV